jgi:hypothetical protein
MSDNTTTPVQVSSSDDKSKTPAPSNDQKGKGSNDAGTSSDDKPAADQATDRKV